MKDELTPREKDLFEYIILFMTVNGYPPTVREMMKGINTKSAHHTTEMLCKLSEKGYITYKPNSSRTIKVLRFTV